MHQAAPGREKVRKDFEVTSVHLLNFEEKRIEYEAMYKTTKTSDFLFLIFLKFCLETMTPMGLHGWS